MFSSTFVWWRCLLRFVLSQVIFSRCVLCCEPLSLFTVIPLRFVCIYKNIIPLPHFNLGLTVLGRLRVWPCRRQRRFCPRWWRARVAGCRSCPVLPAPRASTHSRALPSAPQFVLRPRLSLSFVSCRGHPRRRALIRPQVSLLLSLPPPLSHLSPPNGGGHGGRRLHGE